MTTKWNFFVFICINYQKKPKIIEKTIIFHSIRNNFDNFDNLICLGFKKRQVSSDVKLFKKNQNFHKNTTKKKI